MIVSFWDGWLRAFFVEGARLRLVPVPPSNHFERLRGNLAGFHSIRVNSQWRLIFRRDGSRGEAERAYLDDHSER